MFAIPEHKNVVSRKRIGFTIIKIEVRMLNDEIQLSEENGVLSGWKDIANYLKKGVRTVQRYEHELHLPVRRPAGKKTGSVMATKADLDAWIRAEPITNRESFKFNFPQDTFESLNSEFARLKRNYEQILESRKALRSSVVALQMTVQACHLRRLETQAYQSAKEAAYRPQTVIANVSVEIPRHMPRKKVKVPTLSHKTGQGWGTLEVSLPLMGTRPMHRTI